MKNETMQQMAKSKKEKKKAQAPKIAGFVRLTFAVPYSLNKNEIVFPRKIFLKPTP